jgi:hypothetical protein
MTMPEQKIVHRTYGICVVKYEQPDASCRGTQLPGG